MAESLQKRRAAGNRNSIDVGRSPLNELTTKQMRLEQDTAEDVKVAEPLQDRRREDSESDSDEDCGSSYEQKIIKMRRKREAAFLAVFKEESVAKVSQLSTFLPGPKAPPKKLRRSTPTVVLQTRKSSRLSGSNIDYSQLSSDYVEPSLRRRKSTSARRSTGERCVDFNHENRSGNVEYSCNKIYSRSGTSCHQCRQKTLDQKSYCYSASCSGLRGQFCGYCLLQRYGEDVAVTLKDKTWACPPCRGICNCSICRRNHGKRPTGQLFRQATARGFENVSAYLATLGDQLLTDSGANGKRSRESDDDEMDFSAKKIKIETELTEVTVKQEPDDWSDVAGDPHWQPVIKLEQVDVP